MIKPAFEIFVLQGRKHWYWRIVARNGETIAHSESYSTRRAAIKTARNFASFCDIKWSVV